jgi:hypothetical protein
MKFVNLGEQEALRRFLSTKLDNMTLQKNKKEKTIQMALLATWLTEIYLDRINQAAVSSSI